MKNNIFLTLALLLLFVSCNSDSSLRNKIPGWYSCIDNTENGNLSGKITYYKNGEVKLVAELKGDIVANRPVVNIVMMGTWRIENGYLKEEISKVTSSPQYIGDAIYETTKKDEIGNPGDKIIHVNKEELQVQTVKGKIITYKRIQQ